MIPYFLFLALCGMPLFFMELSISQYIGLGPIACWKAVSPIFQGNSLFIYFFAYIIIFRAEVFARMRNRRLNFSEFKFLNSFY